MSADRWDEALAWYATLREADEKELTHAVGREWQDWYAHPENRKLFEDLSRLLADRDLYGRRNRPRREELEADPYDLSVSVAQWRRAHVSGETNARRAPAENRRRWWWSGGIAVAASAVAIAALFVFGPLRPGSGGSPTLPAVYQTDVGGLKRIQLSDGSSIILGGRSKVSVAFSAQRRSVSLIEGQAWFKVAHNPRWPFVVAAGDGTVTAVGTAFLVTRESDRVLVTVTEGTVEVSTRSRMLPPSGLDQGLAPNPILAPIRVSRGEELAFHDDGTLSALKPMDTHVATAWTHGRLTFDDQPLRYVIETVNRYSSRHIVIGSSAGTLRFSGIVRQDEIGDWLQSLRAIFPVTMEKRGADLQIEMRASTAPSRGPVRKTQR